jgi:hypothetical protein
MAIVFSCPFDTSLNDVILGTPPTSNVNLAVQSAEVKKGAGALGHIDNTLTTGLIRWDNFPTIVGNVGGIDIWVKWSYHAVGNDEFHVFLLDSVSTTRNRVDMRVINKTATPGTKHEMIVQMYDNSAVIRINITYTEAVLTSGWHRYVLNWKWNDPTGFTRMYHNGAKRIDTTLGNSRNKSGSAAQDIDLYFPAQGNAAAKPFADEWNIANTNLSPFVGQVSLGPQVNRFSANFSR